jgi:DNA-binding response OmpR family regulator
MKSLIDYSSENFFPIPSDDDTPQVIKKKIRKILVVEDQADIRALIKATLNFNGNEVHEASDAYTCLKMVHAIKPDVLVLDIMMPTRLGLVTPDIVTGLDICRALKNEADYCSIPIILLTARGQAADIKEGIQAGADEYIVKPFSPLKLIELINFHLSKRDWQCQSYK